MADLVVRFGVEDHLSPVVKAIDDMRLKIPNYVRLPPLPEDLVVIETDQREAMAVVKVYPSASLLSWLAVVRSTAHTR